MTVIRSIQHDLETLLSHCTDRLPSLLHGHRRAIYSLEESSKQVPLTAIDISMDKLHSTELINGFIVDIGGEDVFRES